MSPHLFAVYLDDLVKKVNLSKFGCLVSHCCMNIFLYADDILLISPSVHGLQHLLTLCESELAWLDMRINTKKSMCIRIGPRYDVNCAKLNTNDGRDIEWVSVCRYLGVYIASSRVFRCTFENAKCKFYRAFNAIFGKVGRVASEEVIINLINFKCLPVLLYGLEACPVNSREKKSLDFPITRIFMKMFRTISSRTVEECQAMFGFTPVRFLIDLRKANFLDKFLNSKNAICCQLAGVAREQLDHIYSLYSVSNYYSLKYKIANFL
jgi:hypothetical protein